MILTSSLDNQQLVEDLVLDDDHQHHDSRTAMRCF